MHRNNAIDFHFSVATGMAYEAGTITMTVSNVMDKTDPPSCQEKDDILIRKGKIFTVLL